MGGAIQYRRDVDGLRAIAVVSVVAFHAFPRIVPGGFVGVDVFFVISGYLISSILFNELNGGVFSIRQFYIRRVRRIFPALIVVLVTSYVFAWLVLYANEFQQFGKHVFGGALFVSNIVLWKEAGYFDSVPESKPLLHLWSLGVEEQFYIVWPLLLWAAWSRGNRFFRILVLIVTTSFAINVITSSSRGVAAFYSPLSRFWELSIGSLVAYMGTYRATSVRLSPSWSNAMSVGGLVLILAGVVLLDKDTVFPGWWALLPTVGAAALIYSGSDSLASRTVLSSRLLVWLGIISYPLYLWHWPLLSFGYVLQGEAPSAVVRFQIILASIFLAWGTYRLVERPIRFGYISLTKFSSIVLSMFILGGLGLTTYMTNGFPSRMVAQSQLSGNDGGEGGYTENECGIDVPEERRLVALCRRDKREAPRYALIGDSKAASLYPGLVRTSRERGRWLFIGGPSDIPPPFPAISTNLLYKGFQHPTEIAFNAVARNKNITTVAFIPTTRTLFGLRNSSDIDDLPESPNYAVAFAGLDKAVHFFVSRGKTVVLVVDNPTLPDPMYCGLRHTPLTLINEKFIKASNRCHLHIDEYLRLSGQYRSLLKAVAHKYGGKVILFDTIGYMCDEETGVCETKKNGHTMYSYTDHISDYAAGLIGTALNSELAHGQLN